MTGFMDYDPDDERGASGWMGTVANMIYNDYQRYWLERAGDPKAKRLFAAWLRLAKALAGCLHSLSLSRDALAETQRLGQSLLAFGDLPMDTVVTDGLVKELFRSRIVADGVNLRLAMEASDELLKKAEERSVILLSLLEQRQLSQRALAYLDRATRLYLWGFDPEAVVMCASVLAAAYEERFPDERMIELQIKKTGEQYEPWQYERAALADRVFSRHEKERAARVRKERNDVLHNVPVTDLEVDSTEAVRTTAHLLDCLFPRSAWS